jgi:outer membrane autotransporter protein
MVTYPQYRQLGCGRQLDALLTPESVIGLTFDNGHSRAQLAGDGRIEADTANLGIYGTLYWTGFFVDGYTGTGTHRYDTQRAAMLEFARGSTKGRSFNSFLGGGYDFQREKLTFGPRASVQYVHVHLNGFTESGSLAPLTIVAQSQNSMRTNMGWSVAYAGHVRGVSVTPQLKVGWEHESAYRALPIDAQLASGAGGTFRVYGPAAGRDSTTVNLGLNVQWTQRLSAYLKFDGAFNSAHHASNVTIGVQGSF